MIDGRRDGMIHRLPQNQAFCGEDRRGHSLSVHTASILQLAGAARTASIKVTPERFVSIVLISLDKDKGTFPPMWRLWVAYVGKLRHFLQPCEV